MAWQNDYENFSPVVTIIPTQDITLYTYGDSFQFTSLFHTKESIPEY